MVNELSDFRNFWIFVGVLLAITAIMYLFILYQKSKNGNVAKLFDKAQIIRCSYEPSIYSTLGGYMFTRMSDGMTTSAGLLKMAVGTAPLVSLPHSVDVKLMIVDHTKNVIVAQQRLPVRSEGAVGIMEAQFPVKPYVKEFICRAWVVAAYYDDGSIWLNSNASAYEEKNKKYLRRKLREISG